MNIIKIPLTRAQKRNLDMLATYLEGLPADYQHFEMGSYFDHDGDCDLPESGVSDEVANEAWGYGVSASEAQQNTLYAASIERFLSNCGTTACAIGHGPAAGIPLRKSEISTAKIGGVSVVTNVNFGRYMERFGVPDAWGNAWTWLFAGDWTDYDNSHYGAAARIRFLLDRGGAWAAPGTNYASVSQNAIEAYATYRVDAPLAAI